MSQTDFASSAAPAPSIVALLNTAIAHYRAKRPQAAEHLLKQALQADPDNPDALGLLGILAVDAKRHDLGVQLLARAVARRGGDPQLLNNLAYAMIRARQAEPAMPHLQRALELQPRYPEALSNMARALRQLGLVEEALGWYDRALAIDPRHGAARQGRAEALIELGRNAEAEAELRRVLADHPEAAGPWADLAGIKTFTGFDDDVHALKDRLTDPRLAPLDRAMLLYALAKAHDDLGSYDEAFYAAKTANELLKRPFDDAAHAERTGRTMAVFSREFLEARRGWGVASERPVLIVGMPRSGTTLVEQILASHPQVHGAGELDRLHALVLSMPERFGLPDRFPEAVTRLSRADIQALGRDYLDHLARHSATAARVTDKLPHNFERLGLVAVMLPEARVIHVRRDPRDTCLSIYLRRFDEEHAYAGDLRALGLHYRQYRRLMAHWRQALPAGFRLLEVDYEDLVADQERVSREMIAFCGVDWDPACLDFAGTRRPVQTISNWQVRQPIYRRSVERWRRYERHLGPLMAALEG